MTFLPPETTTRPSDSRSSLSELQLLQFQNRLLIAPPPPLQTHLLLLSKILLPYFNLTLILWATALTRMFCFEGTRISISSSFNKLSWAEEREAAWTGRPPLSHRPIWKSTPFINTLQKEMPSLSAYLSSFCIILLLREREYPPLPASIVSSPRNKTIHGGDNDKFGVCIL